MATKSKAKAKSGSEKGAAAKRAMPAEPVVLPEHIKPELRAELLGAFDRGICIGVKIGLLGVRRKVSVDKVDVKGSDDDTDKGLVRVSKYILECEAYDLVVQEARGIKRYMDEQAMPSYLQHGLYMLPMVSVEKVDKELRERMARFEGRAEEFAGVYEAEVRKTRKRLGPLWNERDYPPVAAVRRAFYVHVRYLELQAPAKLKTVDEKLFEREKDKLQAASIEAAIGWRALLTETLANLVKHLADRLAGKSEDGKPKVFRDSAITNIHEFLETLEPKNITNFAELKTYGEKIKSLLGARKAEDLRDSKNADDRAELGKQMLAVGAALDKLVIAMPVRRFRTGTTDDD